MSTLTFVEIISKLKNFWYQRCGCSIIDGFDLEIGAATLAPYTAFRVLDEKPYNICQVQLCRRPLDGRFGENPNRLSHYYQMQVILKPAPENMQALCLESYKTIGIDPAKHDIRFIEDDWENPSIGASGLGYEIWCDGMEITQYTYMQKIGGLECKVIAGEVTIGLERLAMYVQNKDHYSEIIWSNNDGKIVKYSDINPIQRESQMCHYYQNYSDDTEYLRLSFDHYKNECTKLTTLELPYPAYECCLKASHILNILDARKAISFIERKDMIFILRELAKKCFELNYAQQR